MLFAFFSFFCVDASSEEFSLVVQLLTRVLISCTAQFQQERYHCKGGCLLNYLVGYIYYKYLFPKFDGSDVQYVFLFV